MSSGSTFYSGYSDDHRGRGERDRELRTTGSYGARTGQPASQAYTGSHGSSRQTSTVTGRRTGYEYGYDTVQEQSGGALYREQHGNYSLSGGSYAPQRTEQRHRSLQASKQMLYDVYAQNIGMLEKLEKREEGGGKTGGRLEGTRPSHHTGVSTRSGSYGSYRDPPRYETSRSPRERAGDAAGRAGRGLGRSDVTLPDQSDKTERDLKAVMEGELACLQAQLRFCPPEVRDETRGELVEKTLGWIAEREEKGVKTGMVDKYASNLLETLLTAGEEAILAGVGALQIGQHRGAEQDRRFHDDPTRKARCPKIRTGNKADVYVLLHSRSDCPYRTQASHCCESWSSHPFGWNSVLVREPALNRVSTSDDSDHYQLGPVNSAQHPGQLGPISEADLIDGRVDQRGDSSSIDSITTWSQSEGESCREERAASSFDRPEDTVKILPPSESPGLSAPATPPAAPAVAYLPMDTMDANCNQKERMWWAFLTSSFVTFVGGLVCILLWRLGAWLFCRVAEKPAEVVAQSPSATKMQDTGVFVKSPDPEIGWMTAVKDWAGVLISAQTVTGRILTAYRIAPLPHFDLGIEWVETSLKEGSPQQRHGAR
ncbi:Calcium-activated potassium channel subunit alpha-1 [Branchiostoma belcheri]|nr:Calcium-activated potassium channel subunit alpha-1 [Branchiostoma belcheri]